MTEAEERYLDAVAYLARCDAAERIGIDWRGQDIETRPHRESERPEQTETTEDMLLTATEVLDNLADAEWLDAPASRSTISRWRKAGYLPDYDADVRWRASTIDAWLAKNKRLGINGFASWTAAGKPKLW